MTDIDFEIEEQDAAGVVKTTYFQSKIKGSGEYRVDIAHAASKPPWQRALDVFLPAGYPQSVTDDYAAYQVYVCEYCSPIVVRRSSAQDSLQAFSSSIAGLISSRAVLEGVGVGDASASPTAALLLSIVQECTGRLATILFAYRLGSSLESECKAYRLAADIFNDLAMVLDCLSPIFPKPIRIAVLSCSSVLRALCGVAANSSKATLSSHFARWGNLGELNAKDSSQETVISLLGMLAGSMVVSSLRSPAATWSALIFLLAVHLGTNFAAVKAVSMRSLNRQRANILFSTLIQTGVCLSPRQVSAKEKIFERDGVLRWQQRQVLGFCRIGVSFHELLKILPSNTLSLHAVRMQNALLLNLVRIFKSESYILWYDPTQRTASLVLKKGATSKDQLQGWIQAMLLARKVRHDVPSAKPTHSAILVDIEDTLASASELFREHSSAIEEAGWDLGVAALETSSGSRVTLQHHVE